MKPQTGTGLANGKIILAGEHAVVYHEPAIACQIERGLREGGYRLF